MKNWNEVNQYKRKHIGSTDDIQISRLSIYDKSTDFSEIPDLHGVFLLEPSL